MKEQGILQAIFNLDNAINLNTAFSDTATYKNPILKSIDAKGNKIATNSGITYFNYNNTSLEHLPELIINTDVSFEPFTSTKLKYLNIKNNSNLNTIFPYMYNLEKIDSSNNIVSQNISFLTNIHLKQLPKLSYNETSTLDSFITDASNLQPTDIDLSNNKNLQILGIYGDSNNRIDGLKSLIVSNEAPFDSTTSPQINVNYTGLDRTALVNLFNSMPYNVGYEVVGNPIITDGVASGFSNNDYLITSSQVSDIKNITEMQVSFIIPSSSLGADVWQCIIGSTFLINGYNSSAGLEYPQVYFNGLEDVSFGNTILADTPYTLKFTNDGTTVTCYRSENDGNFVQTGTGDATLISEQGAAPIAFGKRPGTSLFFNGSIDLNNTYIMVNDVYWFRGQPAMTKTLSCVGAIGNQNKLAIVGNPTIQNGVVSGFSATTYLKTGTNFSTENMLNLNCEFFTKITPTAYNDHECYAIRYYNNSILHGLGLDYDKLCFCPGYPVSGGQAERITSTFSVTYGTTYYLKGVIVGKTASLYYSLDNENYELIGSIDYTGNTFSVTDGFNFGADNTGYGTFVGSIDLNNTYIKVNNELWFGREQYLLPEDKDIVINKGWNLITE